MQKHSREIVSEVLSANDIVEVIGAFLDIKPAGTGRFKALCPFHQEKTPSFSINRDRQMFHCFGCGKSGDAITFLRDFEGLTFSEALRKLADRGGIRLPAATEQDSQSDFEREQLIRLGTHAARLFEEALADPLQGGHARTYLHTRALQDETIRRFRLGYAVDDWDTLRDALRRTGIKESMLEASGLVRRGKQGKLYAFFRNRLMVPIRDTSGNIVAFGGRDLGTDGQTAKYINTPENRLYQKGRVLYGLYEARDAMRQERQAILVEGYFDLMRCFDSGIENVVASCGTALTADQAKLIRRYVPEVIVVFDGDAAGIRAALRGVGILTAAGLTVRALVLPAGQDPDDFVRSEGRGAFLTLVRQAEGFITFYVGANTDRLSTVEGRTEVAREIFTILLGFDDELRRGEYLKQAARELQLDEWAVRREFERLVRDRTRREAAALSRRAPAPSEEPEESAPNLDDCDFVAALLGNEPLREFARQRLVGVQVHLDSLAALLDALFEDAGADMAQRLEDGPARTLYAAAVNREKLPPDRARQLVEKRVNRLHREHLAARAEALQDEIRAAERAHDSGKVMELLGRRIAIEREIEQVGAS